jgi:hypothetical protein
MSASTAARPGRNDLCRCGSGRKYKHCCLPKDDAKAAAARAKAAAAKPSPEPEAASATPTRPPKPKTKQPWKTTASLSFSKRTRMPRKMGGG